MRAAHVAAASFLLLALGAIDGRAGANIIPDAAVMAGDFVDGLIDRLDDPDARFDIADVTSPAFENRFERASASFARCRWYRLRLSPTLQRSGPWILNASVDSATLYEPSRTGFHSEAFGRDTPVASRRIRNGISQIDLLPGDYDRDLYLRIDGQPAPSLSFAKASIVASAVQERDLEYAFYISVYLVLASVAVLFAIATRGKAFAFYALYTAMQAVNKIVYWPLAARTIWPHFAVSSLVADAAYGFIAPASYFLFLRYALETRTWPRVDRIVVGCAVASAVSIGCCYVVDDVVGLTLNDQVVPLIFASTLVVVIVAASVRWRQGFVSAGYYLIGLVALTFGVVAYPFAPFDTADIGFVIEAFSFLAALAFRLVSMTNERQRALLETVTAREATAAEYAKRIKAAEVFNAAFSRFVPREFLLQLGRNDVRDVALGDHVERDMTVMFCDIRSFVAFSEQMTPEAMFRFLNVYFGRLGPIVRKYGGFVDKYLGDGIMALFSGASDRALQAAAELHAEVRRLNEMRAREGERPVEIGVGLHRGRILLATIGEEERYDTTVVADIVNLASRLEGMTSTYGARIIASQAVIAATTELDSFNVRWLGEVAVVGSSTSISTYEVCDGDPAELLLNKRNMAATFTEALTAYRQGDYSTSRMLFEKIVAREPADRVAAYLSERSRQRSALVDAAWDGIERQQTKR